MAAATSEITVEALVKVGGSEWLKNGMHRVYFNDLPKWYGLDVNRYNTGNIRSATLDGETISNSKASKIDGRLSYGKVYYDVATGKFMGRNVEQADLDVIVSAIKAAIARLVQETETQEPVATEPQPQPLKVAQKADLINAEILARVKAGEASFTYQNERGTFNVRSRQTPQGHSIHVESVHGSPEWLIDNRFPVVFD